MLLHKKCQTTKKCKVINERCKNKNLTCLRRQGRNEMIYFQINKKLAHIL